MKTHALRLVVVVALASGISGEVVAEAGIGERVLTKTETFEQGPFGVNDLIANRLEYAKLQRLVVSGILYRVGGRFYLIDSVEKRSPVFSDQWIPLSGEDFDKLIRLYPDPVRWNLKPAVIRGRPSMKMRDVLLDGSVSIALVGVVLNHVEGIGRLADREKTPEELLEGLEKSLEPQAAPQTKPESDQEATQPNKSE